MSGQFVCCIHDETTYRNLEFFRNINVSFSTFFVWICIIYDYAFFILRVETTGVKYLKRYFRVYFTFNASSITCTHFCQLPNLSRLMATYDFFTRCSLVKWLLPDAGEPNIKITSVSVESNWNFLSSEIFLEYTAVVGSNSGLTHSAYLEFWKCCSGVKKGIPTFMANKRSEHEWSFLRFTGCFISGRPAASPMKKLLILLISLSPFNWNELNECYCRHIWIHFQIRRTSCNFFHIPTIGLRYSPFPVDTNTWTGTFRRDRTFCTFALKSSIFNFPLDIPAWFVKNTSLKPSLCRELSFPGTSLKAICQSSVFLGKTFPDFVLIIVPSIS